jgi:hypothetical protein
MVGRGAYAVSLIMLAVSSPGSVSVVISTFLQRLK